MKNENLQYLGIGQYYYSAHIYRKLKGGTFRKLKEVKNGNEFRVDISIGGIKSKIVLGRLITLGITFEDVLQGGEFEMWEKKMRSLNPCTRRKFNQMAIRKYLRAVHTLNKEVNKLQRKKFFEKLFKIP